MTSTAKKKPRRPTEHNVVQALKRFEFKAHDQGNQSTCTAHAVTAALEILLGKKLRTEDLVTGFEDDEEGTTVSRLSRILHTKGQREEKDKDIVHKLRFKKIDNDVSAVKRALTRNLPVIAGVTNFIQRKTSPSELTLKNSGDPEPGKHSIVIMGFCEGGESEGGGVLHVLNSHGDSWGKGGFGTMSYGFFLAYTIELHVPVVPKTNARARTRTLVQ
uniref:Peptidase C39-like domain-containing protein n=1 Tax=Lotharella oceanica TaxID=641309 RepID=A0A7S2TM79_9EUKA|eukprot:CAMPEP_0170183222 /NCGR_PEP_ID=MMETSP0040_2-20121228/30009_1 /TAXON_ID=641309 /ORGANISM="Lotharella oceanica, Strain CCMP622" /LENGTH=216 /DNA_ID=CAMNT_0010428893 /DNA_START=39 /DNA_END=689 /DNA_ORIENTATION=+